MSCHSVSIKFEIEVSAKEKQQIVCDYFTDGGVLSSHDMKSGHDMEIYLKIRWHDGSNLFIFSEADTVSGFSYLNFEKFQEKVSGNPESLDTYYYQSIAPWLDLEKMYAAYTKYMNRVLGQFGI